MRNRPHNVLLNFDKEYIVKSIDEKGFGESKGEHYLLTTKESCDLLGIKRTKLFDLIREKELEKVKIGRKTLVPLRSAVALIERNTFRGRC